MHRWASTAPAFTSPSDNLALRKPIKAVKMLRMQIDPAMCMKTKGAHDKMTGVLQNFERHFMQIGVSLRFQKRKMGESGPLAQGVGQGCAGSRARPMRIRRGEAADDKRSIGARLQRMRNEGITPEVAEKTGPACAYHD
jgi:hypothetical protein